MRHTFVLNLTTSELPGNITTPELASSLLSPSPANQSYKIHHTSGSLNNMVTLTVHRMISTIATHTHSPHTVAPAIGIN